MDVACVGGGPGGLYASILLKKTHPDWEITVYEQNPRDVTYGWGIVFPERTLSNLDDADTLSHDDISETATRWEPFDIYYRGDRFRSSGHTFVSMLRSDLLKILQDRCEDLGVELAFEEPIKEPRALTDEVDLLIGADGISSRTRQAYADELGAEEIEGETRFSWFGTHADFEALSHIFVENEDGIWCAHTYPGPVSTFIVDCDLETWENARLDELPEAEYLAYLENLFADYLDDEELLSQQDHWRTFTTVRNETWYHDNIVLLGDAAHTAHYSIGSGTTMAMEDAIGLASAVEEHGDDVEAALAAYEAQRRPFAEGLQRTGERSRLHFEHIRRFFGQEGIQFTLHHLTRSGRLSYSSLKHRDPELVEEFERWFAAVTPSSPDDPAAIEDPADPVAQPLELRDVTFPNRTVSVAEPTVSSVDGQPSETTLAALQRRADNPGLTMTEPLAVSRDGRITPGSPGLYEESHKSAWAEGLEIVTGPTGAHLVHAGQRGAARPRAFALDRPVRRNEAWAPRLSDQYPTRPSAYAPGAMAEDDFDRVQESFVAATERADTAGFDYLQLHLGNGYLLGSFLSLVTNDRMDEYGGDIDDRLRFPLEVVRAVQAAWPDEKPLGATIPAVDWTQGGLGLSDAFAIGETLTDEGVDLLAPVAGGVAEVEEPDEIQGLAHYSDELRHELGVPTMATVQATTVDEVNTLVGADLCTFYGPFADIE